MSLVDYKKDNNNNNNVPLHTYLPISIAKIQNTDNTFNC